MPDRYGPRGVIALFIPLQNSNMQPEYEAMRPDGISNQIYRFSLARHDRAHDAAIEQIDGALGCWPDLIVVGNSVEMQGESVAQFLEYRDRLNGRIGDVPLLTGTEATLKALNTVGARRLAVISPMSDSHSRAVADFYEELGFDVPCHTGLQIARSEDIIKIGIDEAREAFRRIDREDVDTLLHVGGALGIASSVEDLEGEFGRPVISINIATYWCALRTLGVNEPLAGFGKLAQEPAIRSDEFKCVAFS